MAMMPETREALARYDEWVARTVKSPDAIAGHARTLGRKTRSVARRLRNMLLGVLAVLFGALLYGMLVSPLGFAGIILTLILSILVMLFLAGWPKEREPTLEKLPDVPLTALPAQVEDWLQGQRRALPAPALRDIDRIMTQLDALAPQLAKLDPASPMADDARRLVGDHLPRLVKSYAEVPASHRASAEASARFREGLNVVGSEIDRLTTTIARDSLTALEVEGRFLESRYKGTDKVEE